LVPNSKLRAWVALRKRLDDDRDFTGTILTGLDIREIDADSATILDKITPDAASRDFAQRRQHGNRCFVGYLDERPVFFCWVRQNDSATPIDLRQHVDVHVGLPLPPKWAYFWDAWTIESLRGRGIQPAATSLLLDVCRQQGCTDVLTMVDQRNAPSLKAFGKNGFQAVRVLWHLRILGRDIVLDECSTSNLSSG
jgi:ribosomal protein S18 acetylase RimI-like enzyme